MKVFGKNKGRFVFYVAVVSLSLAGVLSFLTFSCSPVGFEGQPLVDDASSAGTESVTPSISPVPTSSSTPTPLLSPSPVQSQAALCTDIEASPQQFYFPARGGSSQILNVRGTPLGCNASYTCASPGEYFVAITRVGYTRPSGYYYPEYQSLPKIDWVNFSWVSSSSHICTLNVDINVSVDDNSGGPQSLTLEVRGRLGTAQFLKTIVINQEGI